MLGDQHNNMYQVTNVFRESFIHLFDGLFNLWIDDKENNSIRSADQVFASSIQSNCRKIYPSTPDRFGVPGLDTRYHHIAPVYALLHKKPSRLTQNLEGLN